MTGSNRFAFGPSERHGSLAEKPSEESLGDHLMVSRPLRIAVLASLGRNPVSGAARPNRDDVLALAIAQGIGGDITVFHAGTATETALGDFLAYGGGTVTVVPAAADADIVAALAERLGGFDLILTGSRSEGGEGSGLLPYLLAERLGLPLVPQALAVIPANGHAAVTQFLPKGQRRHVGVSLPAMIAIHPMAPAAATYAYARRVAGRIVWLPESRASEPRSSAWRTEPAAKKPIRLKAAERKAGHARMLSAIATEAKGGVVIDDGTPAEKAQAILAYLREHRLIDF